MHIGIITLFPEMLAAISHYGITGRAVRRKLVNIHHWNPRDFTDDKHQTVDDRPYGGGPGMVMLIKPLRAAIKAAKAKLGKKTTVIYPSPQGKLLDQANVVELAQRDNLIFVAGRYEGIDQRVIDHDIDEEWSIGDYVVSGGELPAMVMIDAIIRQQPGALGHELSAVQDSFTAGLLDTPHYTRPVDYQGERVPSILLSGDHQAIAQWHLQQALGRTWQKRPHLLKQRRLSPEEQQLLDAFIQEQQTR